ncbi:MAG: hypothetical protein LUE10_08965 [Alistipes sp.]|nr:hypothetical protein [Alistipes sp.]
MRILRYYDDIFQAHADREYLVSEGVPAEVFNQYTGFALPITFANPTMRPYIGVTDGFYERAAALVPPPQEALSVCPGCGSSELEVPSGANTKKSGRLLRAVLIPLMLILTDMGNKRRLWRCTGCGKEFRT